MAEMEPLTKAEITDLIIQIDGLRMQIIKDADKGVIGEEDIDGSFRGVGRKITMQDKVERLVDVIQDIERLITFREALLVAAGIIEPAVSRLKTEGSSYLGSAPGQGHRMVKFAQVGSRRYEITEARHSH